MADAMVSGNVAMTPVALIPFSSREHWLQDKEQVGSFINKLQNAFQKIEVRRNVPEDQSGTEIID